METKRNCLCCGAPVPAATFSETDEICGDCESKGIGEVFKFIDVPNTPSKITKSLIANLIESSLGEVPSETTEPPPVRRDDPRHPTGGVEFQPADRPVEVAGENGADYFLESMFASHPEWSIVAVKAGAEQTAAAYAKVFEPQIWIPNATEKRLPFASGRVFLVQLVDQAWTLLLRPRHLTRISHEARELANHVGAMAIAFGYEETGGSSVLESYDSKGLLVKVKGKNRERWRKFFRDHNIFVPMFLFEGSNDRSWIVLEGVEPSNVERIDFFA